MIRFEEEMNNLVKLMLNMASVAEEMITKSIKALVDRNMILAEEIIKMDDKVNDMEIEIDNLCIKKSQSVSWCVSAQLSLPLVEIPQTTRS